jgi:HEPN domain-containing protein
MTPNEWLLDETRKWVQRAQGDLRAAEICAAELPATALFHRQQAAEKFLKAYLTWNQTAFCKTHELQELAAACAHIDPALQSALDPATALSKYAWQFRYSGAPYELDSHAAVGGASSPTISITLVRLSQIAKTDFLKSS